MAAAAGREEVPVSIGSRVAPEVSVAVPVFCVGCRSRRAGVCIGYTVFSPPGQQGQSALVQKTGGHPGHFSGPHGFLKFFDPIAA